MIIYEYIIETDVDNIILLSSKHLTVEEQNSLKKRFGLKNIISVTEIDQFTYLIDLKNTYYLNKANEIIPVTSGFTFTDLF